MFTVLIPIQNQMEYLYNKLHDEIGVGNVTPLWEIPVAKQFALPPSLNER